MSLLNKNQIIENFKFFTQKSNYVKVIGEPLDFVLWQGSQWAVTEYGLESRDGSYAIESKHLICMADRGRFDKKQLTKNHVFTHWFSHLSGKNWCDIDDIDHALQAFLLLYDLKGSRTEITPPVIMGQAEAIEYASDCANVAYEEAYSRAIKGIAKNAP